MNCGILRVYDPVTTFHWSGSKQMQHTVDVDPLVFFFLFLFLLLLLRQSKAMPGFPLDISPQVPSLNGLLPRVMKFILFFSQVKVKDPAWVFFSVFGARVGTFFFFFADLDLQVLQGYYCTQVLTTILYWFKQALPLLFLYYISTVPAFKILLPNWYVIMTLSSAFFWCNSL